MLGIDAGPRPEAGHIENRELYMRKVHLVGSVPLETAVEVFEASSSSLGAYLHRLPDGETGDRRNWINFQYGVLADNPQFEFAGPPIDPTAYAREGADGTYELVKPTPLRLRDGVGPGDITIGDLGYARHAVESYETFARLKQSGPIAPDQVFLVCLPTPMGPVAVFIQEDDQSAVLAAYEKSMLREVERMCSKIPHDQLAIQWDIAVEFGYWEGWRMPPDGDWKSLLLDRLALLGDAVPAGVELGFHLCYGDRGHRHFVEPTDTGFMVEVANGLADRVRRKIDFLHLPVPRERTDDDYYRPLADLRLDADTELYLGLVHHTDGVDGTLRRANVAENYVKAFGFATECGFGRRDPSTIPSLLEIHAELVRKSDA